MSDLQKRFIFMVMLFSWAGSAYLLAVDYYLIGVFLFLLSIVCMFGFKFFRKFLFKNKWLIVVTTIFWMLFYTISYMKYNSIISGSMFDVIHYGSIFVYVIILGFSVEKLD